jgi:hypothetical protein
MTLALDKAWVGEHASTPRRETQTDRGVAPSPAIRGESRAIAQV